MMEEQYWGLDGQVIPKDIVPFEHLTLYDKDTIINTNNVRLVYIEHLRGYLIVNVEVGTFLSVHNLLSNWVKE